MTWNHRGAAELWNVATIAALTISVVLNVALSAKTERLSRAIAALKGERQLKVGQQAPVLEGRALAGGSFILDLARGAELPTLLYVFTPSCGWCYRNADNIRALGESIRNTHRVVGVSLATDGLAEYVERERLQFDVVTELSPESRQAYFLGSTPQTILIDENGRIAQVWTGAYTNDNAKAVTSAFGVALPGLRPPKALN